MDGVRCSRPRWSGVVTIVACLGSVVAAAQPPALGPTAAAVQAAPATWPTRPPTKIYVLPFAMEPGLQEQMQQQASVLPQGPVRKLIADRPRVTDLVTGHDRSVPAGVAIAKLVADELAAAGWPVSYWDRPELPPADGWRLSGQVVSLDAGSAAARNMIGFGAGNASIGIDIAVSDPATAGGQPFFILDSSDKGRRMPGTLPIAAVAGFNPAVVAGKLVASNSGLADITQQRRMADEIARSVAEGVRARWPQ
jgi:hypothetical protein